MKDAVVYINDGLLLMQQIFLKWQQVAGEAIKQKGQFNVIVSGGKTPGVLYRYLAQHTDSSCWSKTSLFLADERLVTEEDPESNFRFVKESFLDSVASGTKPYLYQVVKGNLNAAETAQRYQADLEAHFKDGTGEFPVFDLVILGIGEDGHTASLFPGDAVLNEQKRWVMPVSRPHGSTDRVTVTLPVLNAAKHVFFLALGKPKAEIIAKIWKYHDNVPAVRIKPSNGRVHLFMDQAASSLLNG